MQMQALRLHAVIGFEMVIDDPEIGVYCAFYFE